MWRSAHGRGNLRRTGGLLVAFGALALAVGQFASMRPRGTDQGLSGALHLIEGGLSIALLVAAMAFAAAGLGGRFRLYTIVTVAVMLSFGAWSATEIPQVELGLPTPWIGVKERIFWYSYQVWFIVLAAVLLREPRSAARPT